MDDSAGHRVVLVLRISQDLAELARRDGHERLRRALETAAAEAQSILEAAGRQMPAPTVRNGGSDER